MLHLLAVLFTAPVQAPARTVDVTVKPEEAAGYPGNPSTLAAPLRQDITGLKLVDVGNGKYELVLGAADAGLKLADFDLALFVPRVPAIAKADKDLTAYALLQREFNRNEVKFGAVGGIDDFKIANNCLRQGMWEVMLDKKGEKGNAMVFHGWFSFPESEYARVFEAQNALKLDENKKILAEYPKIDGMPAPLEKLRTVAGQSPLAVTNHATEKPIQFGEQKRKAKLLLTPGIATYADFSAAEQPISIASFKEPGLYDAAKPVKFDLGWLAKPESAIRRTTKTVQGGVAVDEVEIVYANGYRLVIADRDLGKLAPRDAAPDNDKDCLRLTFGIGTPDIYATLAERKAEQAEDRANWLFLLNKDGRHVDNHQAGVDRVFIWCEKGEPCTLHLYLVGYERITTVGHLTLPWIKS